MNTNQYDTIEFSKKRKFSNHSVSEKKIQISISKLELLSNYDDYPELNLYLKTFPKWVIYFTENISCEKNLQETLHHFQLFGCFDHNLHFERIYKEFLQKNYNINLKEPTKPFKFFYLITSKFKKILFLITDPFWFDYYKSFTSIFYSHYQITCLSYPILARQYLSPHLSLTLASSTDYPSLSRLKQWFFYIWFLKRLEPSSYQDSIPLLLDPNPDHTPDSIWSHYLHIHEYLFEFTQMTQLSYGGLEKELVFWLFNNDENHKKPKLDDGLIKSTPIINYIQNLIKIKQKHLHF